MKQHVASLALLVRDYDEAIHYYTQILGFQLVADTPMPEGKRWVLVAPPGSSGPQLLLAKAKGPRQVARVGDQTGGRVFLFLHTDDFWRDYRRMQSLDVHFNEQPRQEEYGTVVVFEDLYGNKWDLVQPQSK